MSDVPDIATPVRTQAIMNQFGINTKKSLGQNFLTDINILKNIVAAGDVKDTDNVVEIGPGIGALTEQLARAAKQVVAFEIDDRWFSVVRSDATSNSACSEVTWDYCVYGSGLQW